MHIRIIQYIYQDNYSRICNLKYLYEHRDRIKISKKKGYDQPVLLPAD